ncbi:hypothetical protein FPHOBKDP_00103 [Listeria phage LPJP1]|nr:hypothetical protein FPHOBKDP_00103 [Listeria phage LPJP1]
MAEEKKKVVRPMVKRAVRKSTVKPSSEEAVSEEKVELNKKVVPVVKSKAKEETPKKRVVKPVVKTSEESEPTKISSEEVVNKEKVEPKEKSKTTKSVKKDSTKDKKEDKPKKESKKKKEEKPKESREYLTLNKLIDQKTDSGEKLDMLIKDDQVNLLYDKLIADGSFSEDDLSKRKVFDMITAFGDILDETLKNGLRVRVGSTGFSRKKTNAHIGKVRETETLCMPGTRMFASVMNYDKIRGTDNGDGTFTGDDGKDYDISKLNESYTSEFEEKYKQHRQQ